MSGVKDRLVEISLDGSCIKAKNVNPKFPNNVYEYYNLANVKSVYGEFIANHGLKNDYHADLNRNNPYPYTDMVRLHIKFINEDSNPGLIVDLNAVSNQPGWTPDHAGLEQATADVCTWIAAISGGGGITIPNPLPVTLPTPLDVNVTNQIDLTNVETLLTSISNSVSALPDNTDGIEALLGTIITTLGTLDSDDDAAALALLSTQLGTVITELQSLVSNTNNQETLLTSIETLLTTGAKTVSYTEETVPGAAFNTVAGAREVSVYFEGIGGTLTGVEFRDRQSTDADDEGGLNSFSGTVPSINGIDGATRVIIQYVL